MLRPCPFCGGRAGIYSKDGVATMVGCANARGRCWVVPMTLTYKSVGAAKRAWNRRKEGS